jgi:ribosomal protein S27E
MPITVTCPSCAAKLKAPDSLISRTLTCPKCKAAVAVHSPSSLRSRPAKQADEDAPVEDRIDPTPTHKPCPFCAEPIRVAARKCKHCGEMLDEGEPSEDHSTTKRRPHLREESPKRPLVSPTRSPGVFESLAQQVGITFGGAPAPTESRQTDDNSGMPTPQPNRRKRWRHVSPSFAILTFLMFFLPWVEIRCSTGDMAGKVLVSQSGAQAIYGGGKVHPALEGKGGETNHPGSPLMFLYPVLVFSAAAFGLLFAVSHWRTILVGATGGFAVMLLVWQMSIGFPLETEMKRELAERPTSGRDEGAGRLTALAVETRYTAWLWIAFVCNLTAVLVLPVEWHFVRGAGSGLVSVSCPLCCHSFVQPGSAAGQQVRCPMCSTRLTVPTG